MVLSTATLQKTYIYKSLWSEYRYFQTSEYRNVKNFAMKFVCEAYGWRKDSPHREIFICFVKILLYMLQGGEAHVLIWSWILWRRKYLYYGLLRNWFSSLWSDGYCSWKKCLGFNKRFRLNFSCRQVTGGVPLPT